tara:strand:- start:11 stop:463 length:453 start_codon:yes stop_codon:yes gene_type:complete
MAFKMKGFSGFKETESPNKKYNADLINKVNKAQKQSNLDTIMVQGVGDIVQEGAEQAASSAEKAAAVVGDVAGIAGMMSDRRMKKNICVIGESDSGLNVYSFEYKNPKEFGEGTYQGVMSDEIPTRAVITGEDGFDRVNYDLIDVEFKQL